MKREKTDVDEFWAMIGVVNAVFLFFVTFQIMRLIDVSFIEMKRQRAELQPKAKESILLVKPSY